MRKILWIQNYNQKKEKNSKLQVQKWERLKYNLKSLYEVKCKKEKIQNYHKNKKDRSDAKLR